MARRAPRFAIGLVSHLVLTRALAVPFSSRALLPSRPVPSSADNVPSSTLLTPQAMIDMARVGGAVVSPDGSKAVFEVRQYDWGAKRFDAQLWLADLASASSYSDNELAAHKHLTMLTSGKQLDFSSISAPQFSPCGAYVAFLSDRGEKGHSAVWLLPVHRSGEARLLKRFDVPVSDLSWTSDGIVVSAAVYVDEEARGTTGEAAMSASASRDKALRDTDTLGGLNAVLYKRLPMREWDRFLSAKMKHPFHFLVEPCGAHGYRAADAPAVDLVAAAPTAIPCGAGGGREDWSLSCQGGLAVSCRPPLADDEAWTTNRHIYLQRELPKVEDAQAAWGEDDGDLAAGLGECLSAANPGYDTDPAFSPDGTQLAWLTMAGSTYEADAVGIQLYDLATRKAVPLLNAEVDWAHSPDMLHWSADGKRLYFTAQIRARRCICHIDVDTPPAAGGEVTVAVNDGSSTLHAEYVGAAGERSLLYSSESLLAPPELVTCRAEDGGGRRQLTHFNRQRLAALELGRVGELTFKGADGEEVQAWLVRPSGLSRRDEEAAAATGGAGGVQAPLAVVIHGGPQAAVCDEWSYRWNLQAYAAAGFATLAVNFHGSTGFGHGFTRAISGDWEVGVRDVLIGTSVVLDNYPWIDRSRVVGLGGSFGGFAVNWLNGNAAPGLFRALVCHCGTFDAPSSYWATDELFFKETEFGGLPSAPEADEDDERGSPWRRLSPSSSVAKWRTPCLVIHGAKDYRLVESEGIATFTALQRNGVPSELLYLPGENHHCLNPQNSIVWHETVISWIRRWSETEPSGA